MEAELREAFGRLEGKVDSLRQDLHAHSVESARETQKVTDTARAAHRRLDEHVGEHKEAKRWFGALWLAVIGSGLAAIGALLKGFFGGGQKP